MSVQVAVLSFYRLDQYYVQEAIKGMCLLSGNYLLKEEFSSMKLNPECANFPKSKISLKDIPYCFDKDFVKKEETANEEKPYCKYAIAKMLKEEGNVKLWSDCETYAVITPKRPYFVDVDFSSCTCGYGKSCHHIEAVKLSTRKEVKQSNSIKLANVRRKSRGQRSGKKGPQEVKILHKSDELENCDDIDDSIGDAVMIPVKKPKQSKRFSIKSRFVAISSTDENKKKTLTIEKVPSEDIT